MASILECVLQCDVFFGELVVEIGSYVCGGDWWWGSGRDGSLLRGRVVVGVLEDTWRCQRAIVWRWGLGFVRGDSLPLGRLVEGLGGE